MTKKTLSKGSGASSLRGREVDPKKQSEGVGKGQGREESQQRERALAAVDTGAPTSRAR